MFRYKCYKLALSLYNIDVLHAIIAHDMKSENNDLAYFLMNLLYKDYNN